MSNASLKQHIQDYLEQAHMMQVATSAKNQPWCCTVYFAFDDDWNLSWLSLPDRRHSQEIASNNKVAGVITLPHTPGDKVRGLQFEGTAMVVANPSAADFKSYASRYGLPKEAVEDLVSGSNPHKLYVIKPTSFVLYDEVNYPEEQRQVYLMDSAV